MCCKSVALTVTLGSIPAELLMHYVRRNRVQNVVKSGDIRSGGISSNKFLGLHGPRNLLILDGFSSHITGGSEYHLTMFIYG